MQTTFKICAAENVPGIYYICKARMKAWLISILNISSSLSFTEGLEDTSIIFKMQTWLPDFTMGMNCFRNLTHWGRVTHICVNKLIIGSDNGFSPGRRQAIIWTNAGILLIRPLGTQCSEIWIEINIFSLKNMHFKMSSAKCRPFRRGLNVLTTLSAWAEVTCHVENKTMVYWSFDRQLKF